MKENKNIDKKIFIPTASLFLFISIVLLIGGNDLYTFLSNLYISLSTKFGFIYMWLYVINFGFLIWLAFSKYGQIRLGNQDEKPRFSNFAWISMIFTTGIDASIMIMSVFEPIQYLQNPPFGIEAFSSLAYDYAHMYGQFHWGPSAWMMYLPATLAVSYTLYVKKKSASKISDACLDIKVIKEKSSLRRFIDISVIFGIMGAVGASIALEIPVISSVFSAITGVANGVGLDLTMLVILLLLFGLSVYIGLDKGIALLSTINIVVVLGFLLLVLFVGPTQYILDSQTSSMGLLISNFFEMSFYTDPNALSGFAQSWTVFYWGWWLAYMPIMGIFVTMISRGRTIKQVIIGQVVWGSLGCMTFFAILGGYSLYLQQYNILDVVNILNTYGQEVAIAQVIGTLPFSTIMLVIYCVSCFIFLATTVSSTTLTIATMTSKKITGDQEPSKFNRMTWSFIFVIFAAGIIVVGGFETVQVVCVLASFPLIIVCIILLVNIYKKVVNHQDEKG